MFDIAKTAIVTGAARGIGLAITSRLIESDINVVMCDRDAAELTKVSAALPSERIECIAIDVSADEAAKKIHQAARQRWGNVSILVNNAAIAPKYDGRALNIIEMTDDEWSRIIDVNLTSVMRLCREILPSMKDLGWGRVITISSSGGRTRALGPVGPAYMASKSALFGLTRHIASEMGPFGITANAVAPGRIDTKLSATTGQQVAADYASNVPVKRIGTPDEVAAAVQFLASPSASFINGAVIDVNGGMFML